jgi:hypothetical protein
MLVALLQNYFHKAYLFLLLTLNIFIKQENLLKLNFFPHLFLKKTKLKLYYFALKKYNKFRWINYKKSKFRKNELNNVAAAF